MRARMMRSELISTAPAPVKRERRPAESLVICTRSVERLVLVDDSLTSAAANCDLSVLFMVGESACDAFVNISRGRSLKIFGVSKTEVCW